MSVALAPLSACYREYAPSAPLQASVRAFFTFAIGAEVDSGSLTQGESRCTLERVGQCGDPLWSNLFADSHSSLVCCVGGSYSIEDLWRPTRPLSHLIGPMARSHRTTPGVSFIQVGVYFTSTGVGDFLGLPIHELADRVVALEDLWGAEALKLDEQLCELANDEERVSAVELTLLRRLKSRRRRRIGFDLGQLTACAQQQAGIMSVATMADLAGVSRQYLSRAFRDQIGVSPKLFLRLARFRSLLAASSTGNHDWADLAARAGYTDQSHMIADFRKFSGSTPAILARTNTFHPFRCSR